MKRLKKVRKQIASSEKSGNIIVFGYGSSLVANPDILIYADMPRWEIQQRMRKSSVMGMGVDNHQEPFSIV